MYNGDGARTASTVTVVTSNARTCNAVVDDKCFLLLDSHKAWDEAKSDCSSLGEGFYLASVLSSKENDEVRHIMDKALCCAIWIGLHDQATEGTFVFASMPNFVPSIGHHLLAIHRRQHREWPPDARDVERSGLFARCSLFKTHSNSTPT